MFVEARNLAGRDGRGRSAGPAGARACPPRAALLLARSGPRQHRQPARPAARCPTARSLGLARRAAPGPATSWSSARARTGAESLAALRDVRATRPASTGYRLRPSQPKIKLSKQEATSCSRSTPRWPSSASTTRSSRPSSTRATTTAVLIMPGRYTEPDSRSAPENDPTCNPSLLQEDASGDLTPSYEYQVTCPNDQNLIYVQGRALAGDPPEPPSRTARGSRLRSSARACAATCRSRAPARSPRT